MLLYLGNDPLRVVRMRPLASVAVSSDRYSLSYSVAYAASYSVAWRCEARLVAHRSTRAGVLQPLPSPPTQVVPPEYAC